MEYQFYRIKVRGIRWQIAQAGAGRLDDLLHTRDFMEGDVIDHYNVAALERWDQTLLEVRQEGFSVHSSLYHHWRHDTGLTQASNKCGCFPVSHGDIIDQALPARIPTVEAHHVCGHRSLVDKYKAGGIKPALLADPASACPSDIGSFPLSRPQTFFDGDAMTSEEPRECAAASADALST